MCLKANKLRHNAVETHCEWSPLCRYEVRVFAIRGASVAACRLPPAIDVSERTEA